MTKIISFKKDVLQDQVISTDRITWVLHINAEDPEIMINLKYHADSQKLHIFLTCNSFELIDVLKEAALKEAQNNPAALLNSEMVTIKPTMVQGHLIRTNTGELMARYS